MCGLRHTAGAVNAVAFSSDSTKVATASSDSFIRIWSSTGDFQTKLSGHSGPVNAVAFSPDGLQLASASDDKSCRIWNTSNGKCIININGHTAWVNAVAWSEYCAASRMAG